MMKKYDEQLAVLDRCLDHIQSGEKSIRDCLNAYPEHVAFLESVLPTALELRSQLSPGRPSQAYAEITKTRILNQIQSLHLKCSKTKPRPRLRLFPSSRFASLLAGVTLVLALILTGFGVTSASAQALPGDMLYGVKRGMEEVRLFLSTTVSGDADLLAQFTQERLDELEQLATSQRAEDFEQALVEYETLLSRLLEVADQKEIQDDQNTLEKIQGGIAHHEEVLQRVLENAPPSAHEGLENAIEKSSHGQSVIETIQGGGNPSDLAPGQEKKDSDENEKGKPEGENDKPHPKDKTPVPKPKDDTPDT